MEIEKIQNNLFNRKIVLGFTSIPVSVFIPGTSAQTAGNYGVFFIADDAYKVISIQERHGTAGSANGTMQVQKVASGTASGSGKNLMTASISLTAAADTVQYGTLTTTDPDLMLKKGDSLTIASSGTLTNIQSVSVTVIIKKI